MNGAKTEFAFAKPNVISDKEYERITDNIAAGIGISDITVQFAHDIIADERFMDLPDLKMKQIFRRAILGMMFYMGTRQP